MMKREHITIGPGSTLGTGSAVMSDAVRVGDLLLLSGRAPIDPATMQLVSEDFTDQAEAVLRDVESVLAAAGATLDQVVRVAEELALRRPETPVKALISEAVWRVNKVLTAFPAGGIGHDALICKAVWQPLEPGAQPATTQWSLALGQSKEAAVARVFARLRRQRVKGWRGTIPADLGWSYLADRIQPRRRGVRKFGRPRSKSDLN